MVSFLSIITLPMVCPGKLLLKWRTWNWTIHWYWPTPVIRGRGIRRGMAMISHWYARVKVPGMENYDASKRNSYIMYLDANNLYGWVMSQALPMSNFKWLTDKEMKDLYVMMIPDDSSRVYILECDLSKYYFYYI